MSNATPHQASFTTRTASITILLLAFALRLYQLDAQSIWWDEGHSILMAASPVVKIPTLPGMDVHPPGFFVALHGWVSLAGENKFALRYLSVIFSTLLVALVIPFGQGIEQQLRLRQRSLFGLGIWTAVLVTLSPFYVAYAQEVRMYAMVTFFATGSAFALWHLIFSNHRDRRWILAYILFTTATLYTHYFTLFLLAFENLAWLVWFGSGVKGRLSAQWRPRLFAWVGTQFAILLLFAPQLTLALRQVTTYNNPNLNSPTFSYFLSHSWQAYTIGLTTNFAQAWPYLWVLLFLLAMGFVFYPTKIQWLALLAWLVIPLSLYFVVLQRQPSYEPRYLSLITPAIYFMFGLIIIYRRWTRWLGLVVVGILTLGLYTYFVNPAILKDDADGVTEYLARNANLNDIVLVDVPHPFHYYADQINAPTGYLFVDVHTAAETLNQLGLGRDRLYWITWRGSDTDPREVIPYLLQKQAGLPIEHQQFRGFLLRGYQLSDQLFSLPTTLTPMDVNFDNQIQLDEIAYSQTISSDKSGWATLHFSQLAPMDVNYKVSLRLRSPDGAVLAQQDKLLLNDRHFQTAAWPMENPTLNKAINVYTLTLTDADYMGSLILEAVVYNADTLAAIAAYGVPTSNNDFVSAQLGQVEAIQ